MAHRITTVKKVGYGFALLTLVLVAAVGLTIRQVARTQAVTHELVNQSAPMSEASLRAINGINYSVSQLRGWMLLDDEQFKTNRAAAWSIWIDPSLAEMKRLVAQSGSDAQREQLRDIEEKLNAMKTYQAEVEPIARLDKNYPAHELMQNEAGPKGAEILEAATDLMNEEMKQEASTERRLLLFHFARFHGSFSRAVESLNAFLPLGKPQYRQQYERFWQENVKSVDQIEALVESLKGAEVQQWSRIKSLRAEFETLATKVIEIRASDQWNVAVAKLRDTGSPRARAVRASLQKLISDLEPQNNANRAALVEMTAWLTTLEWILLAVGVAISCTLTSVIIRDVNGSIAAVRTAVQEVKTSSQEISVGSQQQVAGLNQTATSLNEITTTAEEFKVTMQEFADRARAVQEAAVETAKQSSEGRTLTQESVARIEQVRVNSQAAGESVLKLAEQMQRIGEITATVHEIAEQTKMLALNASIEAARAGEDGRGFAVVATHVRELANQSKEAAGRIEALITGTQKSMQDVVNKIEDGGRLSAESTTIVQQMTTAFEEIALAIKQTTDAMSQINTGAGQQEQGISELVSSITEIDGASKESLASAEQTQKAISSIDRQIARLNVVMESF